MISRILSFIDMLMAALLFAIFNGLSQIATEPEVGYITFAFGVYVSFRLLVHGLAGLIR